MISTPWGASGCWGTETQGLASPTPPTRNQPLPTTFYQSPEQNGVWGQQFQPFQSYGDVLGWKMDFSFSISQSSQWSITCFGQKGSFCPSRETAKYCSVCQGLMAANTLTKGLLRIELLPPEKQIFTAQILNSQEEFPSWHTKLPIFSENGFKFPMTQARFRMCTNGFQSANISWGLSEFLWL